MRKINEDIADLISEPMKYAAFIDAGSYVTRGNGMLTMLFPELGPAEVAKWFRELGRSETFKSNTEAFKSISSRFSASPALKGLYITLKKMKKMQPTQSEMESFEADMQRVVKKIAKIISSKLTDEDQELFDSISAELNQIAETIATKLEGSIVVGNDETPEEKEDDDSQDDNSDDDSGDGGDSAPDMAVAEPSAGGDEEGTSESLEHRVKNIVREILKKAVTKK